MLVTPAGKLVKHFRSLRELVSVFKDFAEGGCSFRVSPAEYSLMERDVRYTVGL